MKFLHDSKYLPHYSQVDNYYFNNLYDFDPNKPLIFTYGYLDDIFNTDPDYFEL